MPQRANAFFVGREELLRDLRSALLSTGADGLSQPHALSGLGGIGKTQVALAYAFRYAHDYAAVFWIRATTEAELIADFAALARLLRVIEPDETDQRRAAQAVRFWMESHSDWLLVIDNADEPALVRPFLPRRGTGHLLLTSRRQALSELAVVKPFQVDVLPLTSSLEFLARRTGYNSVDEMSPREQEAARELAVELGNLPLALEQAAAYIAETSVPFESYLTAYQKQRLQRLEASKPVASEYSESVATTWEINFAAVEAESQVAADFLRAAAFLSPDEVPLELIVNGAPFLSPVLSEAFHPDHRGSNPLFVGDVLRHLTRYSLLGREHTTQAMDETGISLLESTSVEAAASFSPGGQGEPDRFIGYRFHRLVQAVARARMAEAEQREWASRVVRAVAFVVTRLQYFQFPSGVRARIEAQYVYCAQLIDEYHLDFPEVGDLLFNAAVVWRARGLRKEAAGALDKSLNVARLHEGPQHPKIACIYTAQAALLAEQGEEEKAVKLYSDAIDIIDAHFGAQSPEAAHFAHEHAVFYKSLRRFSEAEQCYQRAFDIRFQLLNQTSEMAQILGDWAEMRGTQGRVFEAESLYRRALRMLKSSVGPHHHDVGVVLNNLASLLCNQERFREAYPLLLRALAIAARDGDGWNVACAIRLANLAAIYHAQGRTEKARIVLERALSVLQKVGLANDTRAAGMWSNLAHIYEAQNRYEEAERCFKQARDALLALTPAHRGLPRILSDYAAFLRRQDRRAEAEMLENQARRIDFQNDPAAPTLTHLSRQPVHPLKLMDQAIWEVKWEERVPVRALREAWSETLWAIQNNLREVLKRRLELEHPGIIVYNINPQCQSNPTDIEGFADDDLASLQWGCLCIVWVPTSDSSLEETREH